MIKKLSLLILGAFAMSSDAQAMDTNSAHKLFFGFTARTLSHGILHQSQGTKVQELSQNSQALSLPAIDVISYCAIKDAQQELARNPEALHEACQEGDLPKVSRFLAAGALVNSKSYGKTPLHIAASYGHKEVADLLIKRGAPLDDQDNTGCTPLHNASEWGHNEVVNLLITRGANVESKNYNSWTPLHSACCVPIERTETIHLLLKHNACVDTQDKEGWTPFHSLVYQAHEDIIKLLVCSSFFPSCSFVSLQAQCLMSTLKHLDTIDKDKKNFLIRQLAHLLTASDAFVALMIDQIPLELQQCFINLLQEQQTQCAHLCTVARPSGHRLLHQVSLELPEFLIHLVQVQKLHKQKAQEGINLFLKAYTNRYFKKIQALLKIRNNHYKTACDLAVRLKKGQNIIALFDQITQAENFDQLDPALKQSIIANIKHRFLLESTEKN